MSYSSCKTLNTNLQQSTHDMPSTTHITTNVQLHHHPWNHRLKIQANHVIIKKRSCAFFDQWLSRMMSRDNSSTNERQAGGAWHNGSLLEMQVLAYLLLQNTCVRGYMRIMRIVFRAMKEAVVLQCLASRNGECDKQGYIFLGETRHIIT